MLRSQISIAAILHINCFIPYILLLHSQLLIAAFQNLFAAFSIIIGASPNIFCCNPTYFYCCIPYILLLHFPIIIASFLIINYCIPKYLLLQSWILIASFPLFYCCIWLQLIDCCIYDNLLLHSQISIAAILKIDCFFPYILLLHLGSTNWLLHFR